MNQDPSPKSTWKKRLPYILVALLCLAQLVTFFQLNEFKNRLSNLDSNMSIQLNETRRQIGRVADDVRAAMEAEASLLSSFGETFGEPNLDALTIPATITLALKEVDNSTAVSIQLGDQTVAMQRDGVRFRTTIALPLFFDGYQDYTILVKSGGTTKSQLYGSRYSMEAQFPMLHADVNGGTSTVKNGETFQFKQDITLSVSQISAQFDNLRLVCTVGNAVVYDEPIDTSQHNNGGTLNSLRFSFNTDIQVPANQTLVRKIISTDSYGLVHQSILDIQKNEGGRLNEILAAYSFNYNLLFRQDGTLLYKPYDCPAEYAVFH